MISMQHVSTYNSHLQAKLRTVIAIRGWLCVFGIQYGLQCFCCGFLYTQCDLYLLCYFNLLAPELFFLILAHPVYKI